MAGKPTREEMNIRRFAVLDFARDNSLVINPSKGMEQYIESLFELGCCPCDHTKTRTTCPCEEALGEIELDGRCLCWLFWKDIDTFKRIYKEEDEKDAASEDHPGS